MGAAITVSELFGALGGGVGGPPRFLTRPVQGALDFVTVRELPRGRSESDTELERITSGLAHEPEV
eukprot:4096757-Karenia_brevis.AAC.1